MTWLLLFEFLNTILLESIVIRLLHLIAVFAFVATVFASPFARVVVSLLRFVVLIRLSCFELGKGGGLTCLLIIPNAASLNFGRVVVLLSLLSRFLDGQWMRHPITVHLFLSKEGLLGRLAYIWGLVTCKRVRFVLRGGRWLLVLELVFLLRQSSLEHRLLSLLMLFLRRSQPQFRHALSQLHNL